MNGGWSSQVKSQGRAGLPPTGQGGCKGGTELGLQKSFGEM